MMLFDKNNIRKEISIMEFTVPEIKVVVETSERNANSGKETCDSYDWSGCCYNG